MPADQLQMLDHSGPTDYRPQQHTALNVSLDGQRWILRLHAFDQIPFHHARDARPMGSRRRWRWKDQTIAGNRIHNRAVAVRIAGSVADAEGRWIHHRRRGVVSLNMFTTRGISRGVSSRSPIILLGAGEEEVRVGAVCKAGGGAGASNGASKASLGNPCVQERQQKEATHGE